MGAGGVEPHAFHSQWQPVIAGRQEQPPTLPVLIPTENLLRITLREILGGTARVNLENPKVGISDLSAVSFQFLCLIDLSLRLNHGFAYVFCRKDISF